MRSENGFTLIELLIASAISVIIMGGLTGAFIVFLKNSDTATQRISESHDEQISAAYFATDVQMAETVTTSTLGAPFAPTCAVDTAGTPFITFASPVAGTPNVTYFMRVVGTERQVVRSTGGVSNVLVHNLKTCTGTPPANPDPAFALTATGTSKITNCFSLGGSCTSKYVAITLYVVTVKDPTGLVFTIRGNKRVS